MEVTVEDPWGSAVLGETHRAARIRTAETLGPCTVLGKLRGNIRVIDVAHRACRSCPRSPGSRGKGIELAQQSEGWMQGLTTIPRIVLQYEASAPMGRIL